MIDADHLEAEIAAVPGDLIAVPRDTMAQIVAALRAGNVAQRMLAGQARMDTAIAGLATAG